MGLNFLKIRALGPLQLDLRHFGLLGIDGKPMRIQDQYLILIKYKLNLDYTTYKSKPHGNFTLPNPVHVHVRKFCSR